MDHATNHLLQFIFCHILWYGLIVLEFKYFVVFNFIILLLLFFSISRLFSGVITICSIFLVFPSDTGFSFTIFSAILFLISSSIASAVLWTTFFEVFVASSSPVL